MYREVEETLRITVNEASERFPDNFVLMRMDNRGLSDPMGTVLYVGDDGDELFALQVSKNVSPGLVVDGVNKQQHLGGIVIGA